MSRPLNRAERFLAERAGLKLCKSCGGYMLHQEYSCDTITRYFCAECGEFEEMQFPGYPAHQMSDQCWCEPELVYCDPDNEIYAHRRFI